MDLNTDDLFVENEETLGGLEDEFGPSVMILLKNFDLNSNVIKQPHLEVLRERVAPFFGRTSTGFAEIYAMTDRSGSRKVNYGVSAQRLLTVQKSLVGFGVPTAKVFHRFAKAIGEDFFEFKNKQSNGLDPDFNDKAKSAAFRAVAIALSPAPIGIPTRNFRRRGFAEIVVFCRKHVQQPG